MIKIVLYEFYMSIVSIRGIYFSNFATYYLGEKVRGVKNAGKKILKINMEKNRY